MKCAAGAEKSGLGELIGGISQEIMILQPGAPVTAGAVAPGSVRVIVSRTRAEVPGCPNWSQPSQPNYNNQTMSNFGCGVNSNLAMTVPLILFILPTLFIVILGPAACSINDAFLHGGH